MFFKYSGFYVFTGTINTPEDKPTDKIIVPDLPAVITSKTKHVCLNY